MRKRAGVGWRVGEKIGRVRACPEQNRIEQRGSPVTYRYVIRQTFESIKNIYGLF